MMELLAAGIRWVHLFGASLLVGVFACLVLVVRPAARAAGGDAPERLGRLDRRLVGAGQGLVGLVLASGLLDLWRQAAVASGLGLSPTLPPATLAALLLQTQYGAVWLVRHGLLLMLASLLLLADDDREARDWWALRLQAAGLAAASLVGLAAAGHAVATERARALALTADGVHLLATGVWFGGLPPLAAVLRQARTLPAPLGTRLAAAAAARFSQVGLAAVLALAVTGGLQSWLQVGSVPALLGTPYGRWLLLKLTLVIALVATAATIRLRLLPRLGHADVEGNAAPGVVHAVGRRVLAEAALGAAVLAVAAVLGLTPPGRHVAPDWPLSFRLSWSATRDLPGVRPAVAAAAAVLPLALAATAVALLRRPHRPWLAAGGVGLFLYAASVPLTQLAVDAYPTTYLRPAVPYTAPSIARGAHLYREHCAACHGPAGYGDGPAARGLRPPPADLTARHTADHTAGDLFWWLSRGIRGSAMPGFEDRLSPDDRWDLINFVRTLSTAERARGLGPVPEPEPSLVAPDIPFTTGVEEARSLRDYRGQRAVLLVFFTLPNSAPRLLRLARVYADVRQRGGEILGIPVREAARIYRALGMLPVFFPIAVEGAEEAVAAYRLFRRDLNPEGQAPEPPLDHLELLVDRQGYLRARWLPGPGTGWDDPARLLAVLEELAREAPRAPAPDEHVH